MTGKRPRKRPPARKRGRPPKFRKEFVDQVRKLSMLGATDKEIADFFDVSVEAVNVWKRERKEFLQALREGKLTADAEAVHSLFRRATGWSHSAVRHFYDGKRGKVVAARYTERYPPDVRALIFWLSNRRKKEWRERFNFEHDLTAGLAERIRNARLRTEGKKEPAE